MTNVKVSETRDCVENPLENTAVTVWTMKSTVWSTLSGYRQRCLYMISHAVNVLQNDAFSPLHYLGMNKLRRSDPYTTAYHYFRDYPLELLTSRSETDTSIDRYDTDSDVQGESDLQIVRHQQWIIQSHSPDCSNFQPNHENYGTWIELRIALTRVLLSSTSGIHLDPITR